MSFQNQNPGLVDPMYALREPVLYPQQETPRYGVYPVVPYTPDYQLMQGLQNAQTENVRLKEQLKQKILKEEAFNHIIKMQGNAYFVNLASGRFAQATEFVFRSVVQIIYDPLYGRKLQLQVAISSRDEPGLIDWEDFWADKKWIAFLEQLSHSEIKTYRSVKRVALLLRSEANTIMTQIVVPYLAGWREMDGSRLYYTFSDFRTSARNGMPELYASACKDLPANAKAAAEQFVHRFAPVQNQSLRSFCMIWMHMSFLQTLLLEQGIHLTKIPVIQTENPTVQAYLRSVLTVSPTGVLNTNVSPEEFSRALLSCKDQPSVILPAKFGKNATENMGMLDQVISSGTVILKKRTAILGQCSLGTLPVLLSDGDGIICTYGIPIAAEARDFDLHSCAAAAVETSSMADYWTAFLAYTHRHLEELNCLLKEWMAEALSDSSDREYTAEHAQVLGAMWGVAEFMRAFIREISLDAAAILDDRWLEDTISWLEEGDAQYTAPGGLADAFFATARQAICQRRFPCYRVGQILPSIPRGAIYLNGEEICLDKYAMEQICETAGLQINAVRRELAQQEYFIGKGVNGQSYQTRISLRCGGGETRLLRVYKFRRDCFEYLGEPLLFQEV